MNSRVFYAHHQQRVLNTWERYLVYMHTSIVCVIYICTIQTHVFMYMYVCSSIYVSRATECT
jgi:hypothetical protein